MGLHKSNGMIVIFVVCDRFTKYALCTPLAHPFGAAKAGQGLFYTIVKLHGWPSDRDNTFISAFLIELMKQHAIKMLRSIAFHLQCDDQTKALNKASQRDIYAMSLGTY